MARSRLKTLARQCLAVLAGALAGILMVTAVEAVGHALYPVADPKTTDPDAMAAFIAQLPLAALLFVLAAWAGGGIAGGFVSTCVAPGGSFVPAVIVGALLLAAIVAALLLIPHPVWMMLAGLGIPLPAVLIGGWVARRIVHRSGSRKNR